MSITDESTSVSIAHDALWALSVELSIQLDLNYDDSDFRHLGDAFEKLVIARDAFRQLGFTPPPTIESMLERFERSRGH